MEINWNRKRSIAIHHLEHKINQGTTRVTVFVKGGNWSWGDYGIEFIESGGLHIIPWEQIVKISQLLKGEYV